MFHDGREAPLVKIRPFSLFYLEIVCTSILKLFINISNAIVSSFLTTRLELFVHSMLRKIASTPQCNCLSALLKGVNSLPTVII